MKLLLALSGIITSLSMMLSSSDVTDAVVTASTSTSTSPSAARRTARARVVPATTLPATHPVLRPMRASNGTGRALTRASVGARGITMGALDDVVQRYCAGCRRPTQRRGNLELKQ